MNTMSKHHNLVLPNAIEKQGKVLELSIHKQILEYEGGMEMATVKVRLHLLM